LILLKLDEKSDAVSIVLCFLDTYPRQIGVLTGQLVMTKGVPPPIGIAI
jgi:hypothetical protein